MFVRSLARALGLPLIATSVSAWFAQTAGNLDDVIKAADEVFATAAAVAPAIVFLDELDAVPDRATLSPRGRDWWTPVVTHLLLVLDLAVSGENGRTIVLGATNHPERLDSALIRPGRLDRILRIGPPDAPARAGILAMHLKGEILEGVDLGEAANLAEGMTGAELAEAVKRARRAARVAGRPLALADLSAAIAPPDARSEAERRRTAVHEAGHAVAMLAVGQPAKSGSDCREPQRRRDDGEGRQTGPSFQELARGTRRLAARRPRRRRDHSRRPERRGGRNGGERPRPGGRACSLRSTPRSACAKHWMWRAPPEEATALANLDLELRDKVEADLRRLYDEALALIRLHLPAVNAVADRVVGAPTALGATRSSASQMRQAGWSKTPRRSARPAPPNNPGGAPSRALWKSGASRPRGRFPPARLRPAHAKAIPARAERRGQQTAAARRRGAPLGARL